MAEADRVESGPSLVAVRHIERSAKKAGLTGFDRSAVVELRLGEVERVSEDFARMSLEWRSESDDQRLLPHFDAQLRIHAVIAKGPHASTAVSVAGRFAPSRGVRRHIEDLLFGRRVVDEAMQRFLESLASLITDEPITDEPTTDEPIDLRFDAGQQANVG